MSERDFPMSERAEIEALGLVVLEEYQHSISLDEEFVGEFRRCEDRGFVVRARDGVWIPTRAGLRAFYEHFEERTWYEIE